MSTVHPHFRDGLVKGNLETLGENESIFHMSLHQYYEIRHLEPIDQVLYEDDELVEGYWKQLTLSEFWSLYDLVYGGNKKNKAGNFIYIPLKNTNICIKRRPQRCILRYYLNHNNDEDLARALLILFHPYTNEMEQIHQQNVTEIYSKFKKEVEKKKKSL